MSDLTQSRRTVETERCASCRSMIPAGEPMHVWGEHVVCGFCHERQQPGQPVHLKSISAGAAIRFGFYAALGAAIMWGIIAGLLAIGYGIPHATGVTP